MIDNNSTCTLSSNVTIIFIVANSSHAMAILSSIFNIIDSSMQQL